MSIEANIAARRGAEEMVEFIGEQSHRYWECLIELATAKLPPKPAPIDRLPAMNQQEAIRFEAQTMPWGNHYGKAVGEVECGYLIFVTEGDEFSKQLKRYVKSKRFQERQGDE